jgi:hypothetical protein
MYKADQIDRIAQVLVAIAALFALANGLVMLADPFGWYDLVGTVKATGPANAHFIRDIGLAYLLSAALLGYAAAHLALRWGAALAGAGWLLAHGGLHVWEVMAGICSASVFWQEAPGTLGPPLLALTGIGILLARQRIAPFPLPGGLFLRVADRMTHGLSPYWADLAAAPGRLTEKYQHFMPLSQHHHAAPLELLYMARFGALRSEDCGPCSLINAHGALRQGLPRDLVNAGLAGQPPAGANALAYAFGAAIAAGSADADGLGAEIEAAHGRAVRTELALAASTVRLFPALKRGLGLAQSCSAVPLTV